MTRKQAAITVGAGIGLGTVIGLIVYAWLATFHVVPFFHSVAP